MDAIFPRYRRRFMPATYTAAAGLAFFAAGLAGSGPAWAADTGGSGNAKYEVSCLACHGAALEGVAELGPALADSPFVAASSVAELVAFLKVGRMPGDPGSVTGRPMPGFGWVPDEELEEIAAYVKSRNGR